LRVWDFDAAEADGTLWRGYARRFVNSYVPRFDASDVQTAGKYGKWESEAEFDATSAIKTLHHIACEDRRLTAGERWQGEIALVTVKGDIDDLGSLFQRGLEKPTFAKMASLSRQINAFFALWLPWFCEHGVDANGVARYRNTYTVFAGGDDFFLIGPWESTLALASVLREKFAAYVANPQHQLLGRAEHDAAEDTGPPARAQHRNAHSPPPRSPPGKNAVTLWQRSVGWSDWQTLMGSAGPRSKR
jgi:CRISPR-associated protein Csm1